MEIMRESEREKRREERMERFRPPQNKFAQHSLVIDGNGIKMRLWITNPIMSREKEGC